MRRLPSSTSRAAGPLRTASRYGTVRAWAAVTLGLGLVLAVLAPGAAAGPPSEGDDPGTVEVIEVSGLLDPILVDFVLSSIERAEREQAVALVLQLNSQDSVVSRDRLNRLAEAIVDADVPVAVWIGPSGAKATGGAAEIALVAGDTGMAPGTRIGDVGSPRLAEGRFGAEFEAARAALADRTLDDEEAVAEGLVDRLAPTVGDFNVDLEGFETERVDQDGVVRREPVTATRFSQLPLPSQLLHTAASPAVAYLLLVVGLGLVLFEFFTAGIGVAAVVATLCLVPAGYGLDVLPARGWAVAMVIASALAFAVDIQTGVPRFWTGVGFLLFGVGTLWLYDGLTLSWITLLVVFTGVPVAVLAGMPAMVRTRFSTPTIGREWMVGELGRAVGAVDPEGTVLIREALWRARVNRATPIGAGDTVRVVGLEGQILEVEPEEGGARDYRDRG